VLLVVDETTIYKTIKIYNADERTFQIVARVANLLKGYSFSVKLSKGWQPLMSGNLKCRPND